MNIQPGDLVSRIAVEAPDSIHVLERFGVRFYDSVPSTLGEACVQAAAPLAEVMEELKKVAADSPDRWDYAPLPALVRFILDNHHTWERNKVHAIQALMGKACAESGDRIPELHQLELLFGGLAKGFLSHMKVEEVELFPHFVREVAPAGAAAQARKAHELVPVTERLTHDHDILLTQWEAMRTLMGGFHPKPGTTPAHRELLTALDELEHYQHQHVHKENFILFEKIRQLALKR